MKASERDENDQFLGTGKLHYIQLGKFFLSNINDLLSDIFYLIKLGKHEYRVWYQAPYHGTYPHLNNCTKLFICHLCLEPFRCATTLRRHLGKCELRAPPGIEIYTDSPNNDEYSIAVYEIGTSFITNSFLLIWNCGSNCVHGGVFL